MNLTEQLKEYREYLEEKLRGYEMPGSPQILREAMRYSLLSPGKRLRGSLCLAACEACGGKREDALPYAMALEMIHAYSLIHDDLPAMDNDTLRRGLPTSHVVYGEAMAILAGDGLLSEAFVLMGGASCPEAAAYVARCAGGAGMVGGQALDISLTGTEPDRDTVLRIHEGKTAALIRAAAVSGMMTAGADAETLAAGERYGYHLGLEFQITDDLLDISAATRQLGKHAGKDREEGKLTWVAAVGEEQARLDAEEHMKQALEALAPLRNTAEFLRSIAIYTLFRLQ